MHDAPVPVIVVHGVVLRAAVIPERQRARAPLEAAGELGPDLVAEKKREQRRAFLFGHAAEAHRVPDVDVQRLAARFRVRTYDRVFRDVLGNDFFLPGEVFASSSGIGL